MIMNKVLFGDCRDSMRQLIADGVRVQMCVTSPPYYGLRDYGVDGQIGQEATPEEYVAAMVDVFDLVRALLADDGVLFLSLGDSYYSGNKIGNAGRTKNPNSKQASNIASDVIRAANRRLLPGLKPKDLIGIPWSVAFALRAAGWYLRSEIIWHKVAPMPESVRDRPTRAHEQVFLLAKAVKHGWLDLVQADLEGIGYAVGAVVLPAAGVGAPHIRHRLWFVAESESRRGNGKVLVREREGLSEHGRTGAAGELADTKSEQLNRRSGEAKNQIDEERHERGSSSAVGELGHGGGKRLALRKRKENGCRTIWNERQASFSPGAVNGFWAAADWLPCRDGKWRPVEPGSFPLAHGVPARVGRLRGYGNAIVPQVGAEVIRAYLSCV